MSLTKIPTLYAINDTLDYWSPAASADWPIEDYVTYWKNTESIGKHLPNREAIAAARDDIHVVGGFMERLPLACLKYGLIDYAEMWHYVSTFERGIWGLSQTDQPLFGWRAFHLHDGNAPFGSADMRAFIEIHGAPHILCAWGLGVDEQMMSACSDSFKIYYSCDAPPLRVPPEVGRHFDLILVGSENQRDIVRVQHPDIPCEILTIGPEFADFETFRPLDIPKAYDLVYVACAQAYKRHDILFQAMAALKDSKPVNCLCVCGYGELGNELRTMACDMGIAVDFIGPPGVSYTEVNYHINRARVGIVAGVNDGCPAVLTEYMLADVPVLANASLCCGLRFITPETGWVSLRDDFARSIQIALEQCHSIKPRQYAIERWGWPTSVRQLEAILHAHGYQE